MFASTLTDRASGVTIRFALFCGLSLAPVLRADEPAVPRTGLLVFSYDDVFRVDKELKTWKKAATLDISYRWGRPDAMGCYPAVRAVHPPNRGGEPYIVATLVDGYLVLQGDNAKLHTLPGQFSADGIDHIENTAVGTLFFEEDNLLPVWTLGANGWEVASLEPPRDVVPAKKAMELNDESDTRRWKHSIVC
jgi:hypothetical protein